MEEIPIFNKNALFKFYPVLAWSYKLKFFSTTNLISRRRRKKTHKNCAPRNYSLGLFNYLFWFGDDNQCPK